MCLVLAVIAITGSLLPSNWIAGLDWQPDRIWPEVWRMFSPVAVHYSALHLAANVVGVVALLSLGLAAGVPRRCAWAWATAWPLAQLGLLLQPDLRHFGGLSGVLHAGVAIVGFHLLLCATGIRRGIGMALLVGLAIKVLSEQPWGMALRQVAGWDIALAPAAHASGLVAGLACAVVAELVCYGHLRRARAARSAA